MNLLLICTGNVCRSPAALFLLTERLGAIAPEVSIRSAGIRAVDGAPVDPVVRGLLARRGIDTSRFSARRVDNAMLECADLILTTSTNQRAAVTRMLPSAVHKTLTLKQLARYAPFILESGTGPDGVADRIPWILGAVPRARARAPLGEDSIADPLGKSRHHYRLALDELEQACVAITSLLGVAAPEPAQEDSSGGWWSEMSDIEREGDPAS